MSQLIPTSGAPIRVTDTQYQQWQAAGSPTIRTTLDWIEFLKAAPPVPASTSSSTTAPTQQQIEQRFPEADDTPRGTVPLSTYLEEQKTTAPSTSAFTITKIEPGTQPSLGVPYVYTPPDLTGITVAKSTTSTPATTTSPLTIRKIEDGDVGFTPVPYAPGYTPPAPTSQPVQSQPATQVTEIYREPSRRQIALTQEQIDYIGEKTMLGPAAIKVVMESPDYLLTPAMRESKQQIEKAISESASKVSDTTREPVMVLNVVRPEPQDRGLLGKVADVFKEAATFGKAETELFNRDDIEARYDAAVAGVGEAYDEAKAKAEAEGRQVTETREQYISRVLPTKEEFVQDVLDAQPSVSEIAKEFGLASIPIYGTIRTWEDSPNWARGLGVASDIVFFVPVLGQAAAASRAGTSFARTAANIAVAELKAPVTTVMHPIRTAKTALEPIETIFNPRKIPVEVLEARAHTIRIPVEERALTHPHAIKAPTGVVSPEEAMRVRETLTQQAIHGQTARTGFGSGQIEMTSPALQKVVGTAAVSSSPDIRNFLVGTTVGERITDRAGRVFEGASMFLAPGRMERFVQATATGLREIGLTDKAARAVKLGEIPDQPIKGTIIIRDPELLNKLQDSGKLYKGAAEIETTLPPGTVIPEPSQVLFTRSPYTGERTAILVIGPKFSPAEIAKLKLVGPVETIKDIFAPGPGRFIPGVSDEISKASAKAREANVLYERARAARASGRISEAVELERRGDVLLAQAEASIARANLTAGIGNLPSSPVMTYTGDQDIEGALRALGGDTTAPRVGEPSTPRRTDAPTPPRAEPPAAGLSEIRRDGDIPRDDVGITTTGRTVLLEDEIRIPPPGDGDRTLPPEDPRRVPPPGDRDDVPDVPTGTSPPPRIGVPEGDPNTVLIPDVPHRPRGRFDVIGDKPSVQEFRTRAPGISWKMGRLWIAIYPPYGEDDIVYSPISQPANTIRVKGPKAAWDTIRRQGYEIDVQTYREWARWFAPETHDLENGNITTPDTDSAIPLELPQEEGGIPIGFRSDYWWQ